eukprot:gene14049-biopygen23091
MGKKLEPPFVTLVGSGLGHPGPHRPRQPEVLTTPSGRGSPGWLGQLGIPGCTQASVPCSELVLFRPGQVSNWLGGVGSMKGPCRVYKHVNAHICERALGEHHCPSALQGGTGAEPKALGLDDLMIPEDRRRSNFAAVGGWESAVRSGELQQTNARGPRTCANVHQCLTSAAGPSGRSSLPVRAVQLAHPAGPARPATLDWT